MLESFILLICALWPLGVFALLATLIPRILQRYKKF